eukprot:318760_1
MSKVRSTPKVHSQNPFIDYHTMNPNPRNQSFDRTHSKTPLLPPSSIHYMYPSNQYHVQDVQDYYKRSATIDQIHFKHVHFLSHLKNHKQQAMRHIIWKYVPMFHVDYDLNWEYLLTYRIKIYKKCTQW